ncbi:hypothetical protein BYT27DRAFT_7258734 [Phlegmacium glaucopus]|nr:hypothetical protein BYT27DRAFT_7258734 [Phlegmacium glaucopus]
MEPVTQEKEAGAEIIEIDEDDDLSDGEDDEVEGSLKRLFPNKQQASSASEQLEGSSYLQENLQAEPDESAARKEVKELL